MDYDWTVKLDADTVLNPDRLRCLLSFYADEVDTPAFLAKPEKNSVEGGTVIGQMEVLNRAAMRTFRSQFLKCELLSQGQHLASLADLMYEGTEDGWYVQGGEREGSTTGGSSGFGRSGQERGRGATGLVGAGRSEVAGAGRSEAAVGLSGGDPPNPPCGRTRARSHRVL
jgi:hypothetical protein